MNAKIGRENIYRPTIGKESLHSMSNDNGARLIHFAMSNRIIISRTYFQGKDIYKQTCISPDAATKNQIDHVMIDNKYRSWFSNVRSYRGADADTEHYLVVATLTEKLSILWKENKNRKSTNMLNVDRLRNPLEIGQYRKRINEELCITNEKVENIIPNHETKCTNIKHAITSAAKDLKEKPNHNKKKHWFNNECMETVKKRNDARMQIIHNPSQENQERYKHLKELTNKTIRRQKRQYEKKALEELERERNNPRNFFKHCKRPKQGFKPQTLFLKMIRMISFRNRQKSYNISENILIRLIRAKQITVIGPSMKNSLLKRPNQNARSLILQR